MPSPPPSPCHPKPIHPSIKPSGRCVVPQASHLSLELCTERVKDKKKGKKKEVEMPQAREGEGERDHPTPPHVTRAARYDMYDMLC